MGWESSDVIRFDLFKAKRRQSQLKMLKMCLLLLSSSDTNIPTISLYVIPHLS